MALMQTQHMQHGLPGHALPASNAPEYRDADMYGRSHAAYQQPPPHQQQQQQQPQYQMYNQQYPRDAEQHALKRKRPNSPLQPQPAPYHHLQHPQQHQPPPPPNFRPQQGFAVHGAPPPNIHPHQQQYQQPQQFQQHRGHDRGAR
jgi:hypothetical protein